MAESFTKSDLERIDKIADDLMDAFLWDETEQGFDYWFDVYRNLRKIAEGETK